MSSNYVGRPCPKCAHVRLAPDSAPDRQCPNCGIAYVKSERAALSAAPELAGGRVSGDASRYAHATTSSLDLTCHSHVFVSRQFEMGELFGFETRNRYRISDERGAPIGYAAEDVGRHDKLTP